MIPNTYAALTLDSSPEAIRTLFDETLPLPFSQIARLVPLEGTEEPGLLPVYRNSLSTLVVYNTVNASLQTYYDMWKNAVRLWPDNKCIGVRPFDSTSRTFGTTPRWRTFAEVDVLVQQVGSGLRHVYHLLRFYTPAHAKLRQDIVGLYSPNRAEWLLVDLACLLYSFGTTCMYDVLGKDLLLYILELTDAPIVACAGDKVELLLDLKRLNPEQTKHFIVVLLLDPLLLLPDTLKADAEAAGIELYDLDTVVALGAQHLIPEQPPTPNHIFTILFTLGTTGANPKGVELVHLNFVALMLFLLTHLPRPKNAVNFAFLPLAHLLERVTTAFCFVGGVGVGYPALREWEVAPGQTPEPRDVLADLIDDLKAYKPYYVTLVPRIFSKVELFIKDKIQHLPNTERHLLEQVIKRKEHLQGVADGARGATVHDQTVIQRVRKWVGFDNVGICLTAGAPMTRELIAFLKASLNIGITQGYGLTEYTATMCCSDPFECVPGSSGPTGLFCEMRLRDLPEMGYRSFDVDSTGYISGEVLLRGPQLFLGYYKNPEETTKSISEDGWFSTGDVGRLTPDGRIYIIDRVKNLFKLAQGEYVAPDRIENNYILLLPQIAQLYLHGDLLQLYVVGIVGLNPETIYEWAEQELGIKLELEQQALEVFLRLEVRKKLLQQMNDQVTGQGYDIQGYEKLQNIVCEFNPLTVERGVVTPSHKMKRAMAAKYFRPVIDLLYSEGSIVKDAKL